MSGAPGGGAADGPAQRAGAASADRRRAALRLAWLALTVGTLFALVALTGGLSSERLRDALDGLGWIGPPVFVVVSAALTVACVPGPLLAGASGLLFGTALGTPTAIVAATLGASLAFSISRRFGARAVDELSGRRLRAIQDWIAQRGFLAVLYARILPAMPYSLVNYAAGLTRVPLLVFAAATAIGCAPRAFAYAALGGSLDDLGSPEAIVALCVLVGMALLGLLLAWRPNRLSPSGGRNRPSAGDVTPSGSGRARSSPADRSAARP